jgi:hypothetical protein
VLTLLERADKADVALGFEVEVEIEQELDVLAGAVAEGCELLVERLLNAQRRIWLGPAWRADEPRRTSLQ